MDHEQNIDFNSAMNELENIVSKLENGKNTLEEDLKLYKKGLKLCELCKEKLEYASSQIENDIKE